MSEKESLLQAVRNKLASWLAPSGMLTEYEYHFRSQKWIDTVCHYRNLAIQLGAPPEHMLNDYDRKLAQNHTSDDPGGWEEDTPELWEQIERYEDALGYMADYQMTGTEQTLHIDFQGKAKEALRRA